MARKLDLGAAPANDNAWVRGRPVVRAPRGRARATYAASENLLLPVAFARRMPGWERVRRSAAPATTVRHDGSWRV